MGSEERLADILGDWYERRDRGEVIDPEDVITAHPDLAEGLRARFAAVDFVDMALADSLPCTLACPQAIGPYEIVGELGSGGMGRVYLAETKEKVADLGMGTRVAIKVVHPHLLERPGFFKRFLREAQLGQSVEHVNVVRTLDCDAVRQDREDHHFLVMEYVEGQTLAQLLRDLERVPEELCRHIGREVADGLRAIHEAGVVHRDLKPENVLITEDHVVKVMDLGVARLQDEAVRLSRTGAFVGSLEYAAPEQLRGSGNDVDGRTDLHALGLILYELSTGQHPFRDEAAAVVIRNVLETAPRKAGEVNPQLSPFFEEVVQALLAKDPEERFACAADLVALLEQGESGTWWKDRAISLRVETKRPLRRIRVPRETALYGRDDDLAKLHAAYEKASTGDGQVLLIEGEAGIGKTRLVDEFVGRLRRDGEDVNFLFGSYPPGGAATAAGAFSTAYREQFGEEGLAETLKTYLAPTPILVPAFAALLRGETTPPGAEALTKDSIQTVFVHALRGLASERPTIVLIDDLHFAPEDGRALFASLALSAPGHRILLLGTMRPGVPEDWIANVERLDQAGRSVLSRLGPKDLIRLLKDSFRSDRLARELGVQIAEKSDGNPFFAFEIIRGLREGQFITQRPDGSWVTTQNIEDIQVPSSVLDLVNARVADLGDAERNFLDVASCCGFEFDSRLVTEVLGLARIPTYQMLARIEKRHRLVRASGRRFVFDHHQVQEALYGGLSDLLREEYHAAIARTLEAQTRAGDKEPKELDGALRVDLCEHFLKGAEGEEALRYLDAALRHLNEGYLNEPSIVLADRALDVPGLLVGAARVEVLLRKNGRLHLLGRREEEEAVLTEACDLAESACAKGLAARVEGAVGKLMEATGRYEQALRHHERVLEQMEALGDKAGVAHTLGNLGVVHRNLGDYAKALSFHERALEQEEALGDKMGVADTLGNIGLVHGRLGDYAQALSFHERALEQKEALGDKLGVAGTLGSLGLVHGCLGDYAQALSFYERALEQTEALGDKAGVAATLGNLGVVHMNLGDYAQALSFYERALEQDEAVGDKAGAATTLGNLGLVHMNLGDYAKALSFHERSLEQKEAVGDKAGVAGGLCNIGVVHECLGDYAKALSFYERALEQMEARGDRPYAATTLGNIGYVHWGLGDYAKALSFHERALEQMEALGDKAGVARTLGNIGNVHQDLGDYAKALSFQERALELHRKLNARSGMASALTALGALHARQGRSDAARQLLNEAQDLAIETGEPSLIALAACHQALLPGGDAKAALAGLKEHEERVPRAERMEARFLLWKATHDLAHLEEAKRLLDHLVEHAPEDYRESMLKNVRLHREIESAWKALHPE